MESLHIRYSPVGRIMTLVAFEHLAKFGIYDVGSQPYFKSRLSFYALSCLPKNSSDSHLSPDLLYMYSTEIIMLVQEPAGARRRRFVVAIKLTATNDQTRPREAINPRLF